MVAPPSRPAELHNGFVGRARDLDAVARYFAEGARLVTVVGPPGVGKTRLARESLRRARRGGGSTVAPRYDFDAGPSVQDLCVALAAALGTSATPSEPAPLVDTLGLALASRGPVVVMIDNAEHVALEAASALERWLAVAPDARFLLTSRRRTGARGEVALELGALSLPEPGAPDASEAVQLFIQRTRALRGEYAPTGAELDAVAELVTALDGLPLAIELAAGRMGTLGVAEIRALLARRFDLLASPNGRAERSLRAVLEGSWELLRTPERFALAQCSVFRGGFTLAAAEAVVRLPADLAQEWIVDVLHRLRDQSLLFARPADDPGGAVRFGLYESVREFAAAALASDEREAAAARHAAHYAALDGPAARYYRPGEAEVVGRIAREADNLWAAHRWSRARAADAPHAAAWAARTAIALQPLLHRCGPHATRHALCDDTLRCLGDDGDPALRAQLLLGRALAALRLGRAADAVRDFEAAAGLGERIADPELVARCTLGVATMHWNRGELARARAMFESMRDDPRTTAAPWLMAAVLNGLGSLLALERDFDAARAYYARALAVANDAGDAWSAAQARKCLGDIAHDQQRFAEATATYERALEGFRATRDRAYEASTLAQLALGLAEQGRAVEARSCAEQAVRIQSEIGNALGEGFARMYLAVCLADEPGDAVDATLEAAVRAFGRAGNQRFGALARAMLGAHDARRGRLDEAAAHLAAAEAALRDAAAPELLSAVELYRGVLELSRARAAPRAGTAAGVVDALRARLAAAAPLAAHVSEVRFAARQLAGALASADAGAASAKPRAALVVGPQARWFVVPDGTRVELRKQRAVRLILLRLADARTASPGEALGLAELFSAGWPGERALHAAATNRTHVALTRLRNLGLRGILQSRDDGVLLDPAVPLVWGDD